MADEDGYGHCHGRRQEGVGRRGLGVGYFDFFYLALSWPGLQPAGHGRVRPWPTRTLLVTGEGGPEGAWGRFWNFFISPFRGLATMARPRLGAALAGDGRERAEGGLGGFEIFFIFPCRGLATVARPQPVASQPWPGAAMAGDGRGKAEGGLGWVFEIFLFPLAVAWPPWLCQDRQPVGRGQGRRRWLRPLSWSATGEGGPKGAWGGFKIFFISPGRGLAMIVAGEDGHGHCCGRRREGEDGREMG